MKYNQGNLAYGCDADLVLLNKESLDVISTWIGKDNIGSTVTL